MKFRVDTLSFSILTAIFWVTTQNQGIWHYTGALPWPSEFGKTLFLITFFVFLTGAIIFLLSLVSFKYILKPLVVLLTLLNASADYFMNKYQVVYDPGMIRNIVETDFHEALGLMTGDWAAHFILWGVLPAVALGLLPIRWENKKRQWLWRLSGTGIGIAMIGLVAATSYQDYASLFRNHREIRFYALPTSYTYYLFRHFQKQRVAQHKPFNVLDATPTQLPEMQNLGAEPVIVFVVGETARAENFSLDGYRRTTNPELATVTQLMNFERATSCGTDTASSIPCMFSYDTKDNYDVERARNQDNFLDIAFRAGYDVHWRDNNSGCKGVCDRIELDAKSLWGKEGQCENDHCFDEALLTELNTTINKSRKGSLIVLHMEGSHGPAYYERVPEQFRKFTPDCRTAELQKCSEEEIRNAYDNTILYTDHVLASLIRHLEGLTSDYAPALLYASDHGESLGENGLFLHGMPYFMAPDTQTHIPFMLWVSDRLADERGISRNCLGQTTHESVSHDNISHTLTGLMGIQSTLYHSELDLTHQCRSAGIIGHDTSVSSR